MDGQTHEIMRGRDWPKSIAEGGGPGAKRLRFYKPRDLSWKDWIKQNCKIDPVTGCWLWQRAIQSPSKANPGAGGYGYITYKGKYQTLHRAVWKEWYGEIPEGRHVCHQCDIRNCGNPEHLMLLTHLQNHQDKARKGRSGPVGFKAGHIWFNNGTENCVCAPDKLPPKGYVRGRVYHKPHSGGSIGTKLYNNGTINKRFMAGAEIPFGWMLGSIPGTYKGGRKLGDKNKNPMGAQARANIANGQRKRFARKNTNGKRQTH